MDADNWSINVKKQHVYGWETRCLSGLYDKYGGKGVIEQIGIIYNFIVLSPQTMKMVVI